MFRKFILAAVVVFSVSSTALLAESSGFKCKLECITNSDRSITYKFKIADVTVVSYISYPENYWESYEYPDKLSSLYSKLEEKGVCSDLEIE